MSEIPLNYERVERQLASADIEMSASEVHGVLCGLLCSGQADPEESWYGELLVDSDEENLLVRECRSSLASIYRETEVAINGAGLGFTPFLPEDNVPLRQRATAVSEWCQGFLYGVGLAGVAPDEDLSQGAEEALSDLAEISNLDVQQIEESEEEEDALIEVTEFLWVAAMMVHGERVPDPTERS